MIPFITLNINVWFFSDMHHNEYYRKQLLPLNYKEIDFSQSGMVYIMHGTADDHVGFHHAEILFKTAKQPKLFWKAEGGGHTRVWQTNPKKAEKKVVGFFRKYL